MENLGVILTKEHIIRMAREAGAAMIHGGEHALMGDFALQTFFKKAYAAGAAAEREACAALCEQMDHDGVMIAADCAEAIRARGNQ